MANGRESKGKKAIGWPAIVAVLVPFLTISIAALGQEPSRGETAPAIPASQPQRPKNCRFRQLLNRFQSRRQVHPRSTRFGDRGRLHCPATERSILSIRRKRQPCRIYSGLRSRSGLSAGHRMWLRLKLHSRALPRSWSAGTSRAFATRIDMKETRLRKCESSGLSPDSRFLACVDTGGTFAGHRYRFWRDHVRKEEIRQHRRPAERLLASTSRPTADTSQRYRSIWMALRWPGICVRRSRLSSEEQAKKARYRLSHRFCCGRPDYDLIGMVGNRRP